MSDVEVRGRWRTDLRYAFTGLLAVVIVITTRAGMQWYWSTIGVCTVCILVLGRRRIFRPGVERTADAVVCSYGPWFEGNVYVLDIVLPLMGLAVVVAGFEPGNPAWLPFGGIILLCLTPLFTFAVVRMWRRCRLVISASTLTVRLVDSKNEVTEIPRAHVQAITPKVVRNSVNGVPALQVEISYCATGPSCDETRSVLLGLQLTVQPKDLLDALVAWQAAVSDSYRLLDRVDRLLPGMRPDT